MTRKIYTYEIMISELGEIPYCQCNCGNKVNVHPNKCGSYINYKRSGYPKFINHHDKKTEESKKIVSEQFRGINNTNFEKKGNLSILYKPPPTIEDFINDIGEIPYCKCNCGEKIRIRLDRNTYNKYKKYGYPQYIHGHHARVNNPMSRPEVRAKQLAATNTPEFIADVTKRMIENNPMFDPENVKKYKESWTKERRDEYSGKKCSFYGKIFHSQKIFPHLTPLQGLINMFRWDRLLAKYYDLNNIPYLYEPKFFPLILNGKDASYTPDFYLPSQDIYIEVKGYWRDDAEEKYQLFLKTYPDVKIQLLINKDLKKLGINLDISLEERKIMDDHKELQKQKKELKEQKKLSKSQNPS